MPKKTGFKKIGLLFTLFLLLFSLCAGSVSAAKKPKPKLSKSSIVLEVDDSAVIKLKNNKKKIKWITSNKKIATVKKMSASRVRIRAKKKGTTYIKAKVGKKVYKCKVRVKKKSKKKPSKNNSSNNHSINNKPVNKPSNAQGNTANNKPSGPAYIKQKSVSVSNKNITLNIGDTERVSWTVMPSNATNKSVRWSVDSSGAVSVDKNGMIKALKAGTGKVYCKLTDTNYTATISVTVKKPVVYASAVSIYGLDESKLVKGNTLQLSYSILPVNATNRQAVWKSNTPQVATISPNGVLELKGTGNAEIVCKSADGYAAATIRFTVQKPTENKPKPPIDDTVNTGKTLKIYGLPSYEKKVGMTFKLRYEMSPSSNIQVKWESSDSSVAVIDQNGTVSCKNAGGVTISCKATDGSCGQSITFVIYPDFTEELPEEWQ